MLMSDGLKKIAVCLQKDKIDLKMSSKAFGKGIASGFVDDLGGSCGIGVKSYISGSMQSDKKQAFPIAPIYWWRHNRKDNKYVHWNNFISDFPSSLLIFCILYNTKDK